MIPWLPDPTDDPLDEAPFPPTRLALGPGSPAPGLLCAGGSLRPARLRAAYSQGIFPWFSRGQPILWWSTDPRMVLFPGEFRLHRSLRKTLHRFAQDPRCEIRFNSAFDRVITACAASAWNGMPLPKK